MTRLFTDGAEHGSELAILRKTVVTPISTTYKRTGNYSYVCVGVNEKYIEFAIGSESEFYIRASVCFVYGTSGAPLGGIKWMANTTVLGYIQFSTDGFPKIYVGTTLKTTLSDVPAFLPDTFYLVEIHVIIHDTTGTIELKINGVQAGSWMGDTKPGADTDATAIAIYHNGGASGQGCAYFDDIAVNNTAEAVDNSWCGDGHVIALKPNANGDSSDFTGSDGNSTDNYLLVDDVPHDSDTTYVESATADHTDLYNLAACGLSNVEIQRVLVEAIAKDTDTADGTVKLLSKAGSTTSETSVDLSTSYALYKGTEMLVNPDDSAAWETSDLDALQAGIKVVD